MDEFKCFCCGKSIEVELDTSPTCWNPAYDALWFRAYGNFGSTIFDPLPTGRKGTEFLQIVICDGCVLKGAHTVAHVHNIREHETADVELFISRIKKERRESHATD
ncbi:unnamed protein product [marine sediment metagenome]|uniref:Uncharacterized protein n=1 Tax=marine sediment metagenome TaxID=412755 RepID=X0U6Z7_9ZZZZ